MSQLTETNILTNGLKREPKIIIIGAGISGISCGEYLARNGFTDFQILEASNRTGGRIWSVDVDNQHKTEMGATWIMGIDGNPVYTIANTHHLIEVRNKTLRHRAIHLAENDNRVISHKVLKDLDLMYGRLIQSAEDFYTMGIPIDDENDSVGEYLDRLMEEQLVKYSEQEQHLRRMIFHQRVLLECMVTGCNSLDDVSLSEWGCYEELAGVQYTIPPGFESIIEILKRTIRGNIHLNHEVSEIKWNNKCDDGDETMMKHPQHEICVTCTNGAKFYADHVIVTVSLGVLKHCAREIFKPRLPDKKQLSIDHLGFGVVDKVVVEFDEAIVDPDVYRIELLWEDCDNNQDFSDTWYRKFFSFDVLHEHYLMGWLSGKAASHMETLSDDEIINAIVKILNKFLRKKIPRPKRILRSKWGDNKFTYGAYSYIAVGSHADDIDLLAEPLYSQQSPSKPQVLFAGEATHRNYYSTTHGALLSGQREAQRIIDYSAGKDS